MSSATEQVEIPLVRQHIAKAAACSARVMEQLFIENMDSELAIGSFESPLEMLFFVWWHAFQRMGFAIECELLPQYEVIIDDRRFRLDFMIQPRACDRLSDVKWTPMAIEVDGHTFHERTPEQVIARDQRDRALQRAGWKVFHFSYRELTDLPANCVGEVARFAFDNYRGATQE